MIQKKSLIMSDGGTSSFNANIPSKTVQKNDEDEKKKLEEERQQRIDDQKNKEKNNIRNAINRVEDGLDEINSKLKLVSNILSEDITLDNVGFYADEINDIKKFINSIDK